MKSAPASRVDPLAEIWAELARLRERLATLEARYGPRDQAEAAALPAIARSVDGRRFTSAELFAHAKVDPELAAALEAADVTSTLELGKLLSRLEVQPTVIKIVRVGTARAGVIWSVRCSSPQPRPA